MKTSMPGGDRLLLQGADDLEPGAVAHVGQAGVAVAAEVALEDAAVLGAVEQGPPALELVDPVGRLLGVELGHAPVVEHLAAAHGVAEVDLPVVLGVDVAHGGGQPPSAMTVWALPSSDLQTSAVRRPRSSASMAARRPAPAGPDDDDVVVVCLVVGHVCGPLEVEAGVVDGPAGHQADVEVAEGHAEEADPGELHVVRVERRDQLPQLVADRVLGERLTWPPQKWRQAWQLRL